jgi:hypothetical protein
MIKRTRLMPGVRFIAAATFVVTPMLYSQQPAASSGMLAPERYQDIQVLKDVQADQIVPTMHYFSAALGGECSSCHQANRATGAIDFAADTRSKTTAREMIKPVETVNAGNFGDEDQLRHMPSGA